MTLLGFALIAGVLWLSAGVEDKQYKTYQAHMTESVSGLSANALVKYRGVTVGVVKKISLVPNDPEKVRLLLDIEEGTPVKQDTVAMLNTQGLTGLAYIELSGGTRASPPLEDANIGQTYPEIQTRASLFVRLDQGVSTILQEAEKIAVQLNDILSEENKQVVNNIIKDIGELSQSLAAQSVAIANNAEVVMENSAKFSEGLPALMTQVQTSIEHVSNTAQTTDQLLKDTQQDIRRTTLALAELSENMNQTLSGSRHDITQFTQTALPELTLLLRDLRDLSTSLRHVARDLSRQPNQLIFGKSVNRPGPGEQ